MKRPVGARIARDVTIPDLERRAPCVLRRLMEMHQ